MNGEQLEKIAANLASLNEIVTELAVQVGDEAFGELALTTLRNHSFGLGYSFQGARPSVVEANPRGYIRLPGIHADIVLERSSDGVRMVVVENDKDPVTVNLTVDGIDQLVEALAEIIRSPAPTIPNTPPT